MFAWALCTQKQIFVLCINNSGVHISYHASMLPIWHLYASVYNSPDCTACQGKNHTDRITPKLFGACYVVMSGFNISKPDCLQEVCFIFLL